MAAQVYQEQFITDSTGRKTHIILPVELYERVKPLLDDSDWKITEAYCAQERVAAVDWDTPAMDVYNEM